MKRALVLLALVPLAAACGGTDGAAAPSADPDRAQIEYARCLRQHGVDMPDDPEDLPPGGLSVPERAMKACEKHRRNLGGKRIDMNDPETRDRFARFARCMRRHGYDMPDNAPPDVHLKNPPLWEKASKSCAHLLRENAPR